MISVPAIYVVLFKFTLYNSDFNLALILSTSIYELPSGCTLIMPPELSLSEYDPNFIPFKNVKNSLATDSFLLFR